MCYDILTQPVFNDPSIVCINGTDWDYKFFRCKLSHTVDGNNHPTGPTGSTYWEVVEGRYQIKCAWDITFPSWFQEWGDTDWYYDGSCRKHGSPSVGYRCTVAHEGSALNEPGVGANWQDYWVVYLNALEFFIGDLIVKVGSNGVRYRCIQGHMWSISKEPGTSGGAAY